uniref:Photosystem II Psb31 protein domain-containing protein n=1 Tax=Chrysotila carterae TaxID=13221 RepID=A0A6S9PBF1_CHRCT
MSSLVPRALQLFISGAFRSADVKPTAKALTKLASDITKAAEKGDGATANSKLKDFLTIAKIEKELDTVDGGNFNPKQRRNAGAPPTAEVEAQMGSLKYALYDAAKK